MDRFEDTDNNSTDNDEISAFKYHDNEATFVNQFTAGLFQFHSISWKVTNQKITSGQDPKGVNKIGNGATNRTDKKVSFRVGRKGSEDVANWFKQRAPSNKNTFGSNPDKLNFAFEVDLTLRLSWPEISGSQFDLKFEKIMLAQGHTLSTNNWWFGGANCKNITNSTVSCTGYTLIAGVKVEITAIFVRGTFGIVNPHDQFWLSHLQPKLLSDLKVPDGESREDTEKAFLDALKANIKTNQLTAIVTELPS